MTSASLAQRAYGLSRKLAPNWSTLGPRFLPFADAATVDLPGMVDAYERALAAEVRR